MALKNDYSIVICEFLRSEVEKALELEGLKEIELISDLDLNQKRLLESDLGENKKSDKIILISKSCLKKKDFDLKNIEDRTPQTFYNLDRCQELFIPKELVDHYLEKGYFLIASGALKRIFFEESDEAKLSQEEIEIFKENYTKILLLDTGIEQNIENLLLNLAKKLGIPYKILPVGLDYLSTHLKHLIYNYKFEREKENSMNTLIHTTKKLADYEMVFDLIISKLTKVNEENTVIDNIFTIFFRLFSPEKLFFLEIKNKELSSLISKPPNLELDPAILEDILNFSDEKIQKYKDNSFILRISHLDEILGYLIVDDIEFPEYIDRYINMAYVIADICGLALINARTYQKLLSTLEDLKLSNKELESFAHIISHDLKQPLTNILGYSELLESIMEADAKPKILEILTRLIEISKYMNQMINDLLEYSRVGRKDTKREQIDVNQIVSQILSNSEQIIQNNNIKVTVQSLPWIYANEIEIIQIFQNLINNAIKFRSENKPVIVINATKMKEKWLFYVEDNGIGIPPESIDDIFKIFHRATDEEKYAGTGIGLSVCKKIVERLGGKIWAESELGKGTTIYFTFPSH